MIWDLWLIVGFAGQVIFGARFIFQWIASERERRSHIPVQFWYLSLAGAAVMTVYAIHRRDPVFILGQAAGIVVYVRNLMLIHRHVEPDATSPPPADRP